MKRTHGRSNVDPKCKDDLRNGPSQLRPKELSSLPASFGTGLGCRRFTSLPASSGTGLGCRRFTSLPASSGTGLGCRRFTDALVGLRISNCFSCLFITPAPVSSDGVMGAADTARKRERSEAKTRARCEMLKNMMIIVRKVVGVGVVNRVGRLCRSGIESTTGSPRKTAPSFYREDIQRIGEKGRFDRVGAGSPL